MKEAKTESRKSNMRKPTKAEYKKIVVDMLYNFNEYCKNYGINYYLFYGSLLGAARHKGMIPWDDDIDLLIPRPDYEKLVKSFNNNNDKYKLVSVETDEKFTAPLAKIIDTDTLLVQKYGYKEKVELGIYIDLFVYDGLPDDERKRKMHVRKAYNLVKKWNHSNHKFRYDGSPLIKDVARAIIYLPSDILGYKRILKMIQKNAKKYDYNNSNYIGNLSYVETKKEVYPKAYFEKDYLDFENIKCPVPKKYNEILTKHYDDWKKLPPKENRRSHHNYDCYIKEDKIK